jgi:hypothetical protein
MFNHRPAQQRPKTRAITGSDALFYSFELFNFSANRPQSMLMRVKQKLASDAENPVPLFQKSDFRK